MVMASVTPSKSTGKFIADRVVAFMQEIGCEAGDVIMKSGQEPAIMSIVEAVSRTRAIKGGGRCVVEASPKASSASNGVVERHIQTVEQQVQVMLEDRWKMKIPSKHAVMPWMVEYAGHLINRFEVGKDGKTSYERCKGKRAKTLGVVFGEAVHWRRKPVGNALGKRGR